MFLNSVNAKLLGILGLLISLSFVSSAQAETCTALNVIGATGTSVKKTVSPFSTLVTNNNWNTDFAVPSDRSFNRYVATIIPENNANFDVELNLKYSDNSSSRAYKKDNVAVKVGKPLRLVGSPQPQLDPFQVNVFIGGLNAIGNTYTLSVLGCI
ncbi:MAG: hypothetical protein DCF19_16105 [Pseudanabaena frigida]|uniref:DUF2808 domain-containing protein n=1 Tax=Pseudanabaena frigida TaxID=945775 RepID=A0A2W4W4S4_9CYAN|nr:MAG: hypothetical protein DCF19_16105 [Pseudanabaena frigida]